MLTPFVPTYSSGVQPILDWLKSIHNLPPWAFLFTSDADAMYNNIDTNHAIAVIGSWLDELSTKPGFPANCPLAAMATIMRNNHFDFDNLNFL